MKNSYIPLWIIIFFVMKVTKIFIEIYFLKSIIKEKGGRFYDSGDVADHLSLLHRGAV